MKTPVIITDLTRMQGERICVAGYLRDDTCIRPVFRIGGPVEEWLRANGRVIVRPFAVVEFDVREKKPDPPHTEDRIIDPGYRVSRGMLSPGRQKALLSRIDDGSVDSIFGTAIYHDRGWYVMSGAGNRSLGTISPSCVHEVLYRLMETARWDYRLEFTDQMGQSYRLAVTDLAFRNFLDHLRVRERMPSHQAAEYVTPTLQQAHVYLRIGLARKWEKYPDRCYLQITGVYSFPDYLKGRCFADFALSAEELAAASQPEEAY